MYIQVTVTDNNLSTFFFYAATYLLLLITVYMYLFQLIQYGRAYLFLLQDHYTKKQAALKDPGI